VAKAKQKIDRVLAS
jgi:predicted transcriptional regulator